MIEYVERKNNLKVITLKSRNIDMQKSGDVKMQKSNAV